MDSGMRLPVYLDYSATTPVDPRVAAKMIPWLTEHFGNPASRSHVYGWDAEKAVEDAREQVAALVGADAKEIIWTSGATESNNLAIKGAAHFYAGTKGKHIITVSTEHKAVLDTVKELERQGFEATYLTPRKTADHGRAVQGRAAPGYRGGLGDGGEQRDWRDPADRRNRRNLSRERRHLPRRCGPGHRQDADRPVEAEGRFDVLLRAQDLWPQRHRRALRRRKPRIRLEAQMHGGGHERGMRSGTLATHQIVGMGECFRLAREEMATENERIRMLRDKLLKGLMDIEETYVNGDIEQRVPHNLNVSFNFVEGESLIMAIKDIAVSSGSACTSASLEPSYVLRSLGRSDELAHSSIRFTLGRFTTEADVDSPSSCCTTSWASCANCRRCGKCTRTALI
jgi:cysteine desulfurase